MASLKGDLPRGYEQVERKIATLYPPVDPNLLGAMLNPQPDNSPYGPHPERDVRVRLGRLELWESSVQAIATNGR